LKVITFFNNKGGVGKTSLVYHLAWMFSDLNLRVLVADFDPQANLTASFIDEDRLEQLWDLPGSTVNACINPIVRGIGDFSPPHVEMVGDTIGLLAGDMGLSRFEDALSEAWPKCMDGQERAFRVISVFWRVLSDAAAKFQADVVLLDVGPNLGAINRSALIASDYVVVPLAPDLFSLQGLRNLGPTLRGWRADWAKRKVQKPETAELILPEGNMQPVGYVVMQHAVRLNRPVKAYGRWMQRIPAEYHGAVLGEPDGGVPSIEVDVHRLASLKHYRSLMALAQEARKPVFHLRSADGAIGGHAAYVSEARTDFQKLAGCIAERTGVTLPS